ncbi:MAG: dTDP-4-dehydrorhamnose reductase [Bacteroidota bacterium]
MPSPVILVTGAGGQLAAEIKDLASRYKQFQFVFLAKKDLSIEHADEVQRCFEQVQPAFCINCAAYTAVDKAETDRDAAMRINGGAVGILAKVSKLSGTRLIHISTDYVFNGKATVPYKEEDITDPVNYYGATKLEGEKLAMQFNNECIIVRTSWVYSVHGNNFVKTMMRLMKDRDTLNVVNDQWGSPTGARDLANALLGIIAGSQTGGTPWVPGIYHYSNKGIISWYDFAMAIKELSHSNCTVNAIVSDDYPTPAKRPAYSAFNTDKIKATYHTVIHEWKTSLSTTIEQMIL